MSKGGPEQASSPKLYLFECGVVPDVLESITTPDILQVAGNKQGGIAAGERASLGTLVSLFASLNRRNEVPSLSPLPLAIVLLMYSVYQAHVMTMGLSKTSYLE